MSRVHCSRPQAGLIVYPSSACPAPSPTTNTVSEPDYDRWTASAPATWTGPSVTFSCNPNNPVDGTGSWQETAIANFGGQDADTGNSWTRQATTFRADPATCGIATQNNAKPTAGLCNHGIASSVEGAGPWNWTCTTGQPPTPSTNCSTQAPPPACVPDGSTHPGITWEGVAAQNDCRTYQATLDSCDNQIGSTAIAGGDCACVPNGTTHPGNSWAGNAALNDCRTYQALLDSCNNQLATTVVAGGECPTPACVPNGNTTYGPVTGACDAVSGSGSGATRCSYSQPTYDSCGTYLGDYIWSSCGNGCT